MLETPMRSLIVKLLKPLHAFAVENGGCYPGTPDIYVIECWIECKATEEWPAREKTIVKLRHHFTQGQRNFARLHAHRGGKSFVLLSIAREWLLFDGVVAADHLEVTATRSMLYDYAVASWKKTPTTTSGRSPLTIPRS